MLLESYHIQEGAMTDTERPTTAVSAGKGPRTRKPRRRKRMLTGVSRQRRAANARERRRIQGVNNAFVELKNKIPVVQPEDVSKIETLRLAAKWIAHLTTVLIEHDRKLGVSSSHQALPSQLQDKLQDLLQFELEDFMLISSSLAQAECDRRTLPCEAGCTQPPDLPYDSCDFLYSSGSSPESLADDLVTYDIDIPPLVSVFSQPSSCARDLCHFSGTYANVNNSLSQ